MLRDQPGHAGGDRLEAGEEGAAREVRILVAEYRARARRVRGAGLDHAPDRLALGMKRARGATDPRAEEHDRDGRDVGIGGGR